MPFHSVLSLLNVNDDLWRISRYLPSSSAAGDRSMLAAAATAARADYCTSVVLARSAYITELLVSTEPCHPKLSGDESCSSIKLSKMYLVWIGMAKLHR